MAHLCYKCGNPVTLGLNNKVGRKESCSRCSSDLHVCRNCTHYDPTAYNECREPQAERVVEKERANYCDYFSFGEGAAKGDDGKNAAMKKLDDLFK